MKIFVPVFLAILSLFPALPATADDAPEATTPAGLDAKQQEELLSRRLNGSFGGQFSSFANMFVVRAGLELGMPVGLMTSSKDIAEKELQPVFPSSYHPTFRELLDAIALQTGAAWKYDPSGKFVKSDSGAKAAAAKDFAIFEFSATKREKPHVVELAKGWKSQDMGNWTMYIPPNFPVGMDIYELGTYSAEDAGRDKSLLTSIPIEVSLGWAERLEPNTKKDELKNQLKNTKVGAYDALFFDTTTPTRNWGPIHWRQWVFMVDHRCYFIVSTILPEKEAEILPDVEAMLKSFKLRDPQP